METRLDILARRGRRLRGDGAFRKAALAFGELTVLDPEHPAWWVLHAACLHALRRLAEARKALRQAGFLLRRKGDDARWDTVQKLLEALDEPTLRVRAERAAHPGDTGAPRVRTRSALTRWA